MHKIIFLFLITLFIFNPAMAQGATENILPKIPDTLEGGISFLINIFKSIPQAMKGVWNETLSIWKAVWGRVKGLWDVFIGSKIAALWQKFLSFLKIETYKRKPIIQEEFQKEREEMKFDIGQTIWEKIKSLIK